MFCFHLSALCFFSFRVGEREIGGEREDCFRSSYHLLHSTTCQGREGRVHFVIADVPSPDRVQRRADNKWSGYNPLLPEIAFMSFCGREEKILIDWVY